MPGLTPHYQQKIKTLKNELQQLKSGQDKLLRMIDEAEIPDQVYNSNAIENSTLTLKETEKILLEMELPKHLDLREVYEAKNLAQVMERLHLRPLSPLKLATILELHQLLLTNVDDKIAGRLRQQNEHVMIGGHIAPPPSQAKQRLTSLFAEYRQDLETHYVDKIAKFHLEFETIHPFNDGNGRIGRVIINYQLARLQLPPIIIYDRHKEKYYQTFRDYRHPNQQKIEDLSKILALSLMESLHKRLAYLKELKIIPVAKYAQELSQSVPNLLNKALRQTIPAFREREAWMIGVEG